MIKAGGSECENYDTANGAHLDITDDSVSDPLAARVAVGGNSLQRSLHRIVHHTRSSIIYPARPLYATLSSKVNTDQWKACHRAAFRSTFADRQWPQAMKLAAGLASHGKCMLCFADECKTRSGMATGG